MKRIDLAIIGGGCAGLSLARDIARRAKKKPAVMIFEPRERYENDRTWCFWSLANDPPDALVSQRWSEWKFSRNGDTVVQQSSQSTYCLVSGADFYADSIETIRRTEGIELKTGVEVRNVAPHAEGFLVETSEGEFLARRVVDTRPPEKAEIAGVALYQLFEGVEIETTSTIAGSDIPSLMAHMQVDHDGFGFDYLLPLGSNRWLVEATLFSPDPLCANHLPEKLKASLHRMVPDGQFRCIRREKGMIPMGIRFHNSHSPAGWVRAGSGGGAVRAASGYAYRRIQRWSWECAGLFAESGEVIGHPEDSWLRQKMDLLFLKVLKNEPELSPGIFHRLARGTSADAMARFMMDRARWTDLLAVVWALPKMPFLRNLFNQQGSPALPTPEKGAA